MVDMKNKIINDADYDMITIIAKKYGMGVEDFGKLLSRKPDKDLRHQIPFNADEIFFIDSKAGELNMTRSEYIRRCYMKAIKDKLYMNMDIKELKANTYGGQVVRDIRVSLSFNDAEDYKIMRKVAKDFSLQFSTLIRYFALSVEL